MTKEEYIARYGEEAYNRKRQLTKEWKEANKEKYIKQSKIWYQNNKERVQAKAKQYLATDGKEARQHYVKNYVKERIQNDPIFKIKTLIAPRKKAAKCVSSDEAITLLIKEADECGIPEILDMDFMMDRFYNNCRYGLVYGNLEILKYFYRLMQIKAAKNENFTENDKILLHYFRNCKIGKINSGVLHLNNDWVIDIANVDMAYVEDMIRNIKGNDLLLTEEKYIELKGLTVQE